MHKNVCQEKKEEKEEKAEMDKFRVPGTKWQCRECFKWWVRGCRITNTYKNKVFFFRRKTELRFLREMFIWFYSERLWNVQKGSGVPKVQNWNEALCLFWSLEMRGPRVRKQQIHQLWASPEPWRGKLNELLPLLGTSWATTTKMSDSCYHGYIWITKDWFLIDCKILRYMFLLITIIIITTIKC